MHTNDIFSIESDRDFEACAIKVFNYQYKQIAIYREFCQHLKVKPSGVRKVTDIPFLPIQFFKSHKVLSETVSEEKIFMSSGTTGLEKSKHYVHSLDLYTESFTKAFKSQYGEPEDWVILALLPSYLQQGSSSLVYMVDSLIAHTKNVMSGFYLDDLTEIATAISKLEQEGKKTLLIGVSYALLDLMEFKNFNLKHTTVMETGGMKGRRREMIKEELHEILKSGFGVSSIHSEYGMTELLSQAYSSGDGLFNCPPWMQVLTRDPEDPLNLMEGKTGGINIIDLANLHSCSFIATQDLGKVNSNGNFEILGRFDNSDIRGCNLMVL